MDHLPSTTKFLVTTVPRTILVREVAVIILYFRYLILTYFHADLNIEYFNLNIENIGSSIRLRCLTTIKF